MTPTSARLQVEPVDVDEGEQRRGRDQAAAIEPLGEGDPPEHGPLAQRADGARAENAAGRLRRRYRTGEPGVRDREQRTNDPRPGHGRWARRAVPHKARRAPSTAPAAARPMPRNPTTRPRSRAGYIVPHRRRWNGPPNDRLSQNAIEMATITAGVGQMKSASREAAPRPRRTASWTGERGAEPPREDAQQVRDEGGRGERGETERLEPAAAGDRRQEGGDERGRDAHADRRGKVEREIAPERAPTWRWLE